MTLVNSTKILALFILSGACLAGCTSLTDPTNASARAEKMEKAMNAQKHNGAMTEPKSAPQATQ